METADEQLEQHNSPATPSTVSVNEDSHCNVNDEEREADFNCPITPMAMSILSDQSQCLNDITVNAAQQLLRRQHIHTNGLLDTVLVAACALDISSVNQSGIIQIVFDSVRKHWLTVSNENCLPDHIAVYCSLQLIPSNPCIDTIARLFCCHTESLTLDVLNTQKQNGSVDCGLFAIAYAEMLARKQDPCNIILEQSQMRKHLVRCLQVGQISQFPLRMFRTPRRRCVRTTTVNLFCVCRSIYTAGDKMLQCGICLEWYHDRCVGLENDSFAHFTQLAVAYTCPKCDKSEQGKLRGTRC
jgi:hypothetical protein